MFELRPYQDKIIEQVRVALGSGHKKPLIQLATGSGKTVIISEIARLARLKGNKVTIITPRRKLVYQIDDTLNKHGLSSNILMAGVNYIPAPIVVASVDTLVSRYKRYDLPETDLVIVDEAHLFMSPERLAIVKRYTQSGAIVLGLTATPALGNGSGLGMYFDYLAKGLSIENLIQSGYLVPPIYYAPDTPDLKAVKVNRGGDYNQKQLGTAMDKPKLIGSIVDNWKRLANGKPTVAFCSSVRHSRHVCEAFNAAGIPSEHMDADTPDEEREATFARIESGETIVLCNVYLASYGLDIPKLEVAVIARPTKSVVLYIQTVGRVLRIHDDKTSGLIIDHSGCVAEHGFVENINDWSLSQDDSITERTIKAKEERLQPKEIVCDNCNSIFSGVRVCPVCHHSMIPSTEAIPYYEADLVEIETPEYLQSKRWNKATSWPDKVAFFGELKYHCAEKGYKFGWLANQYRSRSGVWPNDARLKNCEPRPPTKILKGWLSHQKTKYFHGMKKQEAQK